jgi:hypothetical protein
MRTSRCYQYGPPPFLIAVPRSAATALVATRTLISKLSRNCHAR